MATAASSPVLQQIRRLVEDQRLRGSSDQELLRHLAGDTGDAAFHALIGRHGPMVLDVCRSVLGNEADAEDAFQATFLTLARKADSVRNGSSLSCWLHGVAYRTALKARAAFARRRKHEARVPVRVACEADELTWREARQVVHEELSRLAEHLRAPLVLCYLEGKTQDEAAALLGLAKGTLKGRLERGRAQLRQRLVQRGLGPSPILAASAWPLSAVPGTLASATARAAVGIAAGQAAGAGRVAGLICALSAAVLAGVAGVAVHGTSLRAPVMAAAGPAATAKPGPDAGRLVEQLGSDAFAQREAAADRLRSLGVGALPAVRAGTKGPDLEIARRCASLLRRIYADSWGPFEEAFRADKSGKRDFDHPIWRRFKAAAGDSPQSRAIFAEMIEAPVRVRALLAADTEPEAAGAVYAEEMARHLAERQRQLLEMFSTTGVPSRSDAKERPHRGEVATILFLGSYPATARAAPKAEVETHYVEDGIGRTVSGFEHPMRKLYAAWAANRGHHQSVRFAMRAALWVESEDCLAVARRVAADTKLPSTVRASAFPVLAQFGDQSDVALLGPLRGDTAVYGQEVGDEPTRPGGPVTVPPRVVQVRDMAVTMALVLHGRVPSELGFEYGLMSPNAYVRRQYFVIAAGFRNDADREAAHRRAKAWLDNRPKADTTRTAAQIEGLVQRLGASKYLEREAAEKTLRAVGEAALPAVRVGMKSPSAEVARRCARLLDDIRREQSGRGPQR